MRSKSPELMSEIKKYIEDYYLQNRQSPSTTKIAEAVGIARGTAYKYLVEMAEKNMIEYDGQEIRTNVTRKYSGEQTQTPIVGSIPCGSPQYEEENIEEYVSLPTAIFGKGDFFILRASGQSMIEAGIDDGDLVGLGIGFGGRGGVLVGRAVGGGFGLAAAGGQRQGHSQRQDQGQRFFHLVFLLI